MTTESLVCPRLAVVASVRSASEAESSALIRAGLIKVSSDRWLSITEKGRALLARYGYRFNSTHGWIASSEEAQRPFHFKRTHKPTGSVYMADFNASHHPMWGGEEWRYTSVNTLERIASSLVVRWNSARPENDLWSYELALGQAPATSS